MRFNFLLLLSFFGGGGYWKSDFLQFFNVCIWHLHIIYNWTCSKYTHDKGVGYLVAAFLLLSLFLSNLFFHFFSQKSSSHFESFYPFHYTFLLHTSVPGLLGCEYITFLWLNNWGGLPMTLLLIIFLPHAGFFLSPECFYY